MSFQQPKVGGVRLLEKRLGCAIIGECAIIGDNTECVFLVQRFFIVFYIFNCLNPFQVTKCKVLQGSSSL